MDLKEIGTQLEQSERNGATLYLTHPANGTPLLNDDGEVSRDEDGNEVRALGTPMTIQLLSADSSVFRGIVQRGIDERLRNQNKRGGAQTTTSAKIESDTVDALVAVTLSWNITIGGEKPKCTPEMAHEIYTKYLWIREQVDQFVGDRSNFIKVTRR